MILVTEVKGSHPKNRKPTKKWPKRADLLETNFLFTSLEWCENHFSFLDMPFFLFLMLSIREATLVTWQACGTLWGGKANHVLPMIQGGRNDFWCYCRGGGAKWFLTSKNIEKCVCVLRCCLDFTSIENDLYKYTIMLNIIVYCLQTAT